VPRHIQKQREEAAAAGHSPQTPNGLAQSNGYFERPGGLSEMEEEVWSQSEATPVVQNFPSSKGIHNAPPGEWQGLHTGNDYTALVVGSADMPLGAAFNPPVNHMMIDPLLLGSGAAYPPMHAELTSG
tara:strand:+ start:3981 stop:4364 length:384 start_codon:yes stop_codon:yes gene_type:complete